MASAADITVDFAANMDKLPTAAEANVSTATLEGVNFSFYGSYAGGYDGANYLMIGAKKVDGAYVEFSLAQVTKSFTITTGASASIKVAVQLTANGENIGSPVTLDEKGADFSFDIPEANQAAGTVYRLTPTSNKYNAQITKIVFSDTKGGSAEQPEQPAGDNYKKVATVTADSSYVFVAGGKYNALFSKSYGYMSATAVPDGATADSFTGEANAAIKFVAVEGGYNLVTTEGKFLGAKADYKTFDTTDDSAANRVWTVSIDKDGKATITNVATSKVVMQDPQYGSFGCYTAEEAGETYILPELYMLVAQTSTPVTPEPEPTEVVTKSIAETLKLASGTAFTADFSMTVGWVFGKNIFVCDAAGDFIQIYNANTLNVGDVIPAGLKATYTLYNGITPEFEKVTVFPEAAAGTFAAKVVAAADVNVGMVNSVVTIENVVLAEASPAAKENFTGVSDGVELSFRNNYTLESVPADTYDITVVVTIYSNAPSLYVTNYKKATGVAGIEAENNAPVEFFNLQGVRVANPENGMFIRRQGNKVQKVVIR